MRLIWPPVDDHTPPSGPRQSPRLTGAALFCGGAGARPAKQQNFDRQLPARLSHLQGTAVPPACTTDRHGPNKVDLSKNRLAGCVHANS
jgi:hypothetical protein